MTLNKMNNPLQAAMLVMLLFLTGCSKEYTNYYADAGDEGLAIFSDNGNNLLTCYVDGKGWRTVSRTSGGFSYPRTSYEVDIYRTNSSGTIDTLFFSWLGYFNGQQIPQSSITLALQVQKNFSYKDFNTFNRQRVTVNGSNGYFLSPVINAGPGTGNVYFHSAVLDSLGPNNYIGRFNGLFDASFNNSKITRGRFDHTISQENMRL